MKRSKEQLEYLESIAPCQEMLDELKKLPLSALRDIAKRVYKYLGDSGRNLAVALSYLEDRYDFVVEIFEFIKFGKYERGHSGDDSRVKRLSAASLAELDLKLTAVGY